MKKSLRVLRLMGLYKMSLILCPQFQNTISRQRNRCCAIPVLAAALVRQFAGIANLGIATGNCRKDFFVAAILLEDLLNRLAQWG